MGVEMRGLGNIIVRAARVQLDHPNPSLARNGIRGLPRHKRRRPDVLRPRRVEGRSRCLGEAGFS